jgi:ABC-type lipoprotein export system ATPase subunit
MTPEPPSDPVIVQDLVYACGERRVLAGASLRIGPGEIVVVSGRPGAGTTTLLSIVAGMLGGQAGSVVVLGHELCGVAAATRAHVGARIGFVPQARAVPGGWSVGQRQRVALARALASGTALLVADDPTATLDERASREIAALLQRYVRERGAGMLIASHDPAVVAVADRLLVLQDGVLDGLADPERTTIVYRDSA